MYNHNHVYPSYVLYSVVALTSEFLVDPGLGAIFLICFISVSEVFWCPLLPLSPSLQCSCILFDVSFLLTTGKFSSPAQVRLIAQTDEFVLHPFCWGHQLYCWSVQVLYWCPPLMDVLYACCCSAAPLFKTFFFYFLTVLCSPAAHRKRCWSALSVDSIDVSLFVFLNWETAMLSRHYFMISMRVIRASNTEETICPV